MHRNFSKCHPEYLVTGGGRVKQGQQLQPRKTRDLRPARTSLERLDVRWRPSTPDRSRFTFALLALLCRCFECTVYVRPTTSTGIFLRGNQNFDNGENVLYHRGSFYGKINLLKISIKSRNTLKYDPLSKILIFIINLTIRNLENCIKKCSLKIVK